MILHDAIEHLLIELEAAEEKFPSWPTDIVHASAIVAEESGELIQACLDKSYGRYEGTDKMIKEASQTGAMILRFLMGMEEENGK